MNRYRPRTSTIWTAMGTGVLLAVLVPAVVVSIATSARTPRTLEAVAFAATTCLCGGVGGWVVSRWPTRNPALGVAKGLGAVGLRIFLPLAALGWLAFGGRELREAGADRFILVFYLLLLATDIFLNIIGASSAVRTVGKKTPD